MRIELGRQILPIGIQSVLKVVIHNGGCDHEAVREAVPCGGDLTIREVGPGIEPTVFFSQFQITFSGIFACEESKRKFIHMVDMMDILVRINDNQIPSVTPIFK